MTDAQIKLYAALRVSVPPGWRICGRSTGKPKQPTQVIYFTRPRMVERILGIPHYAGTEERVLIVSLPLLEDPRTTANTIWNVVREAQGLVGSLEGPPRLTRAQPEDRSRRPRRQTGAEYVAEMLAELRRKP